MKTINHSPSDDLLAVLRDFPYDPEGMEKYLNDFSLLSRFEEVPLEYPKKTKKEKKKERKKKRQRRGRRILK